MDKIKNITPGLSITAGRTADDVVRVWIEQHVRESDRHHFVKNVENHVVHVAVKEDITVVNVDDIYRVEA